MLEDEVEGGLWPTARDAAFTILVGMNQKNVGSSFLAHMGVLFCFMQELSFPISYIFPWNPDSISLLITMLGLTRLQIFSNTGIDPILFGCYFALTIEIAFFGYIGYIVYDYLAYKAIRRPILLRILRALSALFARVFYIPFIFLATKQIRCSDEAGCGLFSKSLGEVALILLLQAAMLLYLFLFEATVYEWSPLSPRFNSRVSSRAPLLGFFARTVLALLYCLLEANASMETTGKLVLSIFTLLVYSVTLFFHWYDLPYFKRMDNVFYLSAYSMLVWSTLCSTIVVCINNNDDSSVSFGMYAILFLSVTTAIFLAQTRYDQIDKKELKELISVSEASMKFRIEAQKVLNEYIRQKQDGSKLDERFHRLDFGQLDQLIQIISERFSYSTEINYAWATYSFFFKRNRFLAIDKFRNVQHLSSNLYDHITCTIRIRIVGSYVDAGEKEIDVTKYIEKKRLEKIAIMNIRMCMQYQYRFWNSLSMATCSLENLKQSTVNINHTMDIAYDALLKLITLSPMNSQYRRMYAQFLGDVANDEQGETTQVNKAIQIETSGNEQREDDLEDSQNGIIIISGEKEEFGTILAANERAEKLFQYGEGLMQGRKIGSLMPAIYSDTHNSFIKRYIEHKSGEVMQKRRTLLGKDSQGYIFLLDIQVREYAHVSREPRIGFIGIVYSYGDDASNLFTVKVGEKTASDVSKSFVQMTAGKNAKTITKDMISDSKNLKLWFPHLSKLMKEVRKVLHDSSKYTVTLDKKDSTFALDNTDVVLHISYLTLTTEHMLLVKVETEKKDKKSLENKEEVGTKPVIPSRPLIRDFSTFSDRKKATTTSTMGIGHESASEITGGGSSISSSRSSAVIRTMLLRTREAMDPSLRSMLRVIIFSTLTICLFSLGTQLFWDFYVFNRFFSSITFIKAISKLPWSISTCEYTATLARHTQEGHFNVSELNFIQNSLRQVVESVDAFKTSLVVYQNWISSGYRSAMSSPILLDLFGKEKSNLNTLESLHLYAAMSYMITQMNWSQIIADNSSLRFFDNNRDSNLVNVLNSSVNGYLDDQYNQNVMVTLFSEGFVFASVSLVIILALFVFLPTIHFAEQQKMAVYHLFQNISSKELASIFQRTSDILSNLRVVKDTTDETKEMFENEFSDLVNSGKRKKKKEIKPKEKGNEVGDLPQEEQDISQDESLSFRILLNSSAKKLSLLLIFQVLYFAGLHIWWLQIKGWLFDPIAENIYLYQYRGFLSRRLSDSLLNWSAVPELSFSYMIELEAELWEAENALAYGGSAEYLGDFQLNFPSISDQYFSDNLCQYVLNQTNSTEFGHCIDFMDGALTRGEHDLILSLISYYESFRSNEREYMKLLGDNSISKETYYVNFMDLVNQLKKVSDEYLPIVFAMGLETIQNAYETQISTLESNQEVVTGCFVLANLLLLVFIYYPMAQTLNRELVRTRAMINIIPSGIIDNTPVLKNQVQRIVKVLLKTT